MRVIFFFQAEDGIRDRNVTGVQTCALPICRGERREKCVQRERFVEAHFEEANSFAGLLQGLDAFRRSASPRAHQDRSEERRVGKEWRSRWWRCHRKKKR